MRLPVPVLIIGRPASGKSSTIRSCLVILGKERPELRVAYLDDFLLVQEEHGRIAGSDVLRDDL